MLELKGEEMNLAGCSASVSFHAVLGLNHERMGLWPFPLAFLRQVTKPLLLHENNSLKNIY